MFDEANDWLKKQLEVVAPVEHNLKKKIFYSMTELLLRNSLNKGKNGTTVIHYHTLLSAVHQDSTMTIQGLV